MVKVIHYARRVGQRWFQSTVIVCTHTHTHTHTLGNCSVWFTDIVGNYRTLSHDGIDGIMTCYLWPTRALKSWYCYPAVSLPLSS